MVPESLVAKCKSSDTVIVNIRERINKINKEEEEGTPHNPSDLET